MSTKRGPILTPEDWVPGDLSTDSSGDATYDGVSGPEYSKHKGTGGKIKEETFIKEGTFGRIPSED